MPMSAYQSDQCRREGVCERIFTSSAWTYVSEIGSSSAVGMALKKLWQEYQEMMSIMI